MLHLVHPSGNTFVRALLEGLESSGAEYKFWTTIASSAGGWNELLPGGIRSQLARRSYPVPRSRIHSRPLREWVRLLAPAVGLAALTRHETGWASVDAVYRDLDRAVARRLRALASRPYANSWFYAYEDGAFESFRAAADNGIHRAYELPIAYWETSRRLLEEEAERWLDWAGTLVGPVDSEIKLERKTRELELAELIVVPSQFVKRSLPDWLKPEQRVVVAEFGSPFIEKLKTEKLSRGAWRAPSQTAERCPQGEMCERRERVKAEIESAASGRRDHRLTDSPAHGKRPLRVLFAGSLTQRKGLADVFEAMRLLNRSDVELVVMGSPVAPLDFYRRQGVPFTYEPPRPHEEVLKLMRSCDVLLLPSIVEGRALVQQEALACGLPILVTANAGGEDLVVEGETGFLLPIRCPQAIAERLAWLADHRDHLESMRPACRAKAAEYTWHRYAATILNAVRGKG